MMFNFRRRGSIYMMVVGTTAICSTIVMASLLALRSSRRAANNDADFAEARILARSGLEIGMHYIYTDPYWRTTRGNGAWATNFPIGKGSFSLSATDPIDNDVRVGENHPVILTATGNKGNAVCKMSVRMEVGPKTGSCLEVAMCSGDDISVSGGSTLTSNQAISTNHNISGSGGSIINADVEAYNQISGSTYTKSSKLIPSMRILPDPVRVFDSYLAAGTAISYLSLPKATQPELLVNTDFETDVSGWYILSGSTIARMRQDSSLFTLGAASMKVQNRTGVNDVAAQDLPLASVIKGHTYILKMSVSPNANATLQATIQIVTTAGTYTFSTPPTTGSNNFWFNLQGDLTLTWTGTIQKATVFLTTSNPGTTYNMDKLSLKDITFSSNSYYAERVLLSPTANPWGTPNAKGIYVLDCAGKNVIFANCRIVGTLVLKNAGSGTSFQGPIVWEPATPNYPALLTDQKVSITFTSAVLSEAELANFNPPECPYPYASGTGNTSYLDTYPSQITGIVYSANDLNFSGAPTIIGNVVAQGKPSVSSSALNLTYTNTCYLTPPPGFDFGRIPLFPVPGTWQRPTQ